MVRGSCCCGAVQFELLAQPTLMGTCHCSRCRKVGASTVVFVEREHFRWVRGQDHVAVFEPAAPYAHRRCFCSVCGTALGEVLSRAKRLVIAANTLDGPLDVTNGFHEFVADKPSWSDICDDAVQFDRHPSPA